MTKARQFREMVRNKCVGIDIEEGIDHHNNPFLWIIYYLKDGTAILSCDQTIEEIIPLFDPIFEANRVMI